MNIYKLISELFKLVEIYGTDHVNLTEDLLIITEGVDEFDYTYDTVTECLVLYIPNTGGEHE